MITITTTPCASWYQAMAIINGVRYFAHYATREQALADVLRQLGVKGYIKLN